MKRGNDLEHLYPDLHALMARARFLSPLPDAVRARAMGRAAAIMSVLPAHPPLARRLVRGRRRA